MITLIGVVCLAACVAAFYLLDEKTGCTGDCNQGRRACNCKK